MGVRRSHALCVAAAAALLLLLLARLPPRGPAAPRPPRAHPPPRPPEPAEPVATSVANLSASPPAANASSPRAAPPPRPPPRAASHAAHHDIVAEKTDNTRVVLTKEVYVAGHSIIHAELCPDLGARIRLLILIASAPSHSSARDAIRLTWGHYTARADVAIAFMLGTPPDSLRAQIDSEDAIYNDIIMGNFLDTYSNLTLKSLSMLEWTASYCPRAHRVLKTDDDMFINVPRLMQFMDQSNRVNATKTIWGKVLKKAYPMRIAKSKYYLSRQQYPGRLLPQFATGPAYLMTPDCISLLLQAAPNRPYVRLEDVFVTGILADVTGIKRQHAHEFYNKKVSPHPCAIQRGVAVHMVRYHEQFDLWRKALDNKTKCS